MHIDLSCIFSATKSIHHTKWTTYSSDYTTCNVRVKLFTIRVFKLSDLKRERLRKISVRIYVVFLIFLGILNLVEENNLLGWGHILIGIGFLFADQYGRKRKNL